MIKKSNRAYFYAVGRRKSSRATVRLFPEGEGNIEINEQPLISWADTAEIRDRVLSPFSLLGIRKNYDLSVIVSGGGKESQSDSIALGISRALIKKNIDYKAQLKEEGFLTRDPRKKERKKPGLKKARRAPQFSKR